VSQVAGKSKEQREQEKKQLRYVAQRKKHLEELYKLTYERNEVSKRIRKLQKEMAGWDSWLYKAESVKDD